MANDQNRPEKVFRAGSVRVSVFRNAGQYGVYRTCTVSVAYKKGSRWEYGQIMKVNDAIVAAALLEDARKYMMDKDTIEAVQQSATKPVQTTQTYTAPAYDDDYEYEADDDVPF